MQSLAHSPLSGMEERIKKAKAENSQFETDNLIGKINLQVQAKQKQEFIHYLPSVDRSSATSWKSDPQHTLIIAWEDKPLTSSFPSPLLLSVMS